MASDIKKVLGQNIRESRKKLELSQKEFAEIVGLDRALISELERGQRNTTIDTISKIADGLKIDIVQLFIEADYEIVDDDNSSKKDILSNSISDLMKEIDSEIDFTSNAIPILSYIMNLKETEHSTPEPPIEEVSPESFLASLYWIVKSKNEKNKKR